MASRSSHPALSCADNFAASSADVLQLLGRILMSYLFLSAGWGKLFNVIGTTAYFTGLGVPSPSVMAYFVGSLEVAVGVALILGIATRYAAIVVFIFVLVATAIAHRYWTLPSGSAKGTICPVREKSRDHERVAVRACRRRWALLDRRDAREKAISGSPRPPPR